MVVLGGVTRLTRSGLSIVEWKPVVGAIPPLSQSDWNTEFEKYQQTPEYKNVNTGMSLGEFQRIYYVEWAHRLLGRVIALAVVLPLAYFALRRRISITLAWKLAAVFCLGAAEGALGWYMVSSGLIDVPRVSPYRLTAHLALAVAIYGCLVWIALDLIASRASMPFSASLTRTSKIMAALVFLVMIAGGFVAGTRAGFVFNTFPSMNGQFMPPGLYAGTPWWADIFENVATVQFHHRLLAYALLIAAFFYWRLARKSALPARLLRGFDLFLAAVVGQALLGVATLLWIVPVPLAAAHQAGALVVFTLAIYLTRRLRYSR